MTSGEAAVRAGVRNKGPSSKRRRARRRIVGEERGRTEGGSMRGYAVRRSLENQGAGLVGPKRQKICNIRLKLVDDL